ncbi:hypothetical protein [Suttonella ornithocola]|uniref:hypothetical protein n=1 Tax=Suttonella ornithocola TaxID=279832 RepID=UPI0014714BF8|nr:hypothetical protein [Suttonella ornithocola]
MQRSPFLCLEPSWQGIVDREGFTGVLQDKMGILAAAPNQCWTGSWQVKIKFADKEYSK